MANVQSNPIFRPAILGVNRHLDPRAMSEPDDEEEAGPPSETCLTCASVRVRRVRLSCAHWWCRSCLHHQARESMNQHGLENRWPPSCCPLGGIDERIFRWLGDRPLFLMYRREARIKAVPRERRLWCHVPSCETFIHPDEWRVIPGGPIGMGHWVATCPSPECRRETCVPCRGSAHPGRDCEVSQQIRDQIDYAVDNEHMICWSCGLTVERTAGCSEMTCSCRAEFCYMCGGPRPCHRMHHRLPYVNDHSLRRQHFLEMSQERIRRAQDETFRAWQAERQIRTAAPPPPQAEGHQARANTMAEGLNQGAPPFPPPPQAPSPPPQPAAPLPHRRRRPRPPQIPEPAPRLVSIEQQWADLPPESQASLRFIRNALGRDSMWNQGPINEERDADLAILPVQDQNWHRMMRNTLENGGLREEHRRREEEIEREVERRLAERLAERDRQQPGMRASRTREERIEYEVERRFIRDDLEWGVSEDGTRWDPEFEGEVDRRWRVRDEPDRQREQRIDHEVERWFTGANINWGVSEDGSIWDGAFEREVDVRWRKRLHRR